MDDLWFMTNQTQILNLRFFKSFWMEKTTAYHVFGKDADNAIWKLSSHDNQRDGQNYIENLYLKIKGDFHENQSA